MFSKKHQAEILIALFLIVVAVWIFVFKETKIGFLEINFFDVGQGDAEFIETPSKQQVLIDGGPDLTILEKLGKAMPFYDRYIDLIILTHPEADHLNGLIEVLKRYQIGGIVLSGIIRNTSQYQELINVIKNKNIPIYIAQQGGEIDFSNNINLKILYPLENSAGKQLSDSNNSSVVTQLVYGDFAALFTGDIEKSAENNLIKSEANLNSDILKIAHHGSKTSTSSEFLKAVNAALAIIEVSKDNSYGHPHQEVLERLKNILTLQTAQEGDIGIFSNGTNFWRK